MRWETSRSLVLLHTTFCGAFLLIVRISIYLAPGVEATHAGVKRYLACLRWSLDVATH